MKPSKPAVPRVLGCLVKGPLGCLAFTGGALLVFVVFMPRTCGRMLEEDFERSFSENHAGSLQITRLEFPSLVSEQRFEGVTLRDPGDVLVARGDFFLPPLIDFVEERVGTPGHQILLHLEELELEFDEAGHTGLDRALVRLSGRPRFETSVRFGDSQTIGPGSSYSFDLLVDRLRLASGRPGLSGELVLMKLAGKASIEWGAEVVGATFELFGGIEGEPDGTVRLGYAIDDLGRFLAPDAREPGAWRVEFQGLSTRRLDGLVTPAGFLAGVFGEHLDSGTIDVRGPAQARDVVLLLEGERAKLDLLARLDGQARALTGHGPEHVLTLDLATPYSPADPLLGEGGLLPFLGPPLDPSTDRRTKLLLGDFALPLDGDLGRASGDVVLRLPAGTYALAPYIQGLVPPPVSGVALTEGRLELTVHDGDVSIAHLPFAGPGIELAVAWSHSLIARTFTLGAALPARPGVELPFALSLEGTLVPAPLPAGLEQR